MPDPPAPLLEIRNQSDVIRGHFAEGARAEKRRPYHIIGDTTPLFLRSFAGQAGPLVPKPRVAPRAVADVSWLGGRRQAVPLVAGEWLAEARRIYDASDRAIQLLPSTQNRQPAQSSVTCRSGLLPDLLISRTPRQPRDRLAKDDNLPKAVPPIKTERTLGEFVARKSGDLPSSHKKTPTIDITQ